MTSRSWGLGLALVALSGCVAAPAPKLATLSPDAKPKAASGHVRLRCIVTTAGRLRDCAVIEEKPAGLGFGAASLKTTPMFKMHPAMRDGVAVEGVVIIPIKWVLDPQHPAVPTMSGATEAAAATTGQAGTP